MIDTFSKNKLLLFYSILLINSNTQNCSEQQGPPHKKIPKIIALNKVDSETEKNERRPVLNPDRLKYLQQLRHKMLLLSAADLEKTEEK